MGEKTLYKIRISSTKIVGPIGIKNIQRLLEEGKITGSEPTQQLPTGPWKSFTSFPELANLAMKVIEKKNTKSSIRKSKLNPKEEVTKTLIENNSSGSSEVEQKRKSEDIYVDVPTLPKIEPKTDPDLEPTKVVSLPKRFTENIASEKTIVIPESELLPISEEKGAQEPVSKIAPTSIPRKLISKNIFYILCIGVLILVFNPPPEEKRREIIENLAPKPYKFKRVQVNAPKPSKKKPDKYKSKKYFARGKAFYRKDTPTELLKAIKYSYRSVFYDPSNLAARSLLASAYIRASELIPRNKELFQATTDLLTLSSAEKNSPKPIEYIVAQVEYYINLQLFERANTFLKRRVNIINPHPELLYMEAKLASIQGEKNRAAHTIARAIKLAPKTKRNPRHMIFYAEILEKKGNTNVAKRILRSVLKNNPRHGEARYHYAELLLKERKIKQAFGNLVFIIQNPSTVDKVVLAKAFMLTARIYDRKRRQDKAIQFAAAARKLLPEDAFAKDLFFKIYAKGFKRKNTQKYLLVAREKERQRKYSEAINFYIRARETSRGSTFIMSKIGDLYKKMGRPKNAMQFYKKAISVPNKKNTEAYIKLAEMHIKRYELKDAKNVLRASKGILKRSPQLDYIRGLIHLRKNNKERARSEFAAAIQKGARIPRLYVDMGNLEIEKHGKGILSEFYYNTALRYNPLEEDALLGIALSRFHRTSPSEAINLLKLKLYEDPTSSAIMTNLALVYLRLGDKEAGKNYLQKAVRLDPNYARSYKLIGDLVKEESDRQQDFEEKRRGYKFALASYSAYSKLRPNDPDIYMASADLFFTVQDLGAAAQNYNKVLALAPDYPGVRIQLAKIAINGQDITGARELVEEEIKNHPNSSAAYTQLGKIHLLEREFAQASSSLTIAARLSPKNVDAVLYLGYVYYLQGKYGNAIALFERALDLDPLRDEIHWKIGLAYEKEGKYRKAIISYKDFIGLSSDRSRRIKAQRRIASLKSNTK